MTKRQPKNRSTCDAVSAIIIGMTRYAFLLAASAAADAPKAAVGTPAVATAPAPVTAAAAGTPAAATALASAAAASAGGARS
jgi:hypothetical protein